MQTTAALRSRKYIHAASLTFGAIAGWLTHIRQVPVPTQTDFLSRFIASESRYENLIFIAGGVWLVCAIVKGKRTEPECSIVWGGLGFVIAVLLLALSRSALGQR